ncbi:Natural resistance-associated macrophage protein [Macrophomina phaseolina MS6]|uniref:Natural resistance-associated macrophage protein n=1 Tax=Macrophomina phaseolina (strain MS6) TaxID=1126212 RepID=K2RIX7_MACPH|nr:Natural resistance-associated macrophage protein [Macrophomina phaseolina MS6]
MSVQSDLEVRQTGLATVASSDNGGGTQDPNTTLAQALAAGSGRPSSDENSKIQMSFGIVEVPSSLNELHGPLSKKEKLRGSLEKTKAVLYQYAKFIGPGFMVAVAYIDPGKTYHFSRLSKPFLLQLIALGNYATDVAAGASFRFALLFVILMSNIFAIFLQSLSVKLGTVTGKNLAENSREHLPKWLNVTIYVLAEVAIVATDVAEVSILCQIILHPSVVDLTEVQVIGTAIALNVLGNVPLVAGCAISIVDVLVILIFYQPQGGAKAVRLFEYFVMILVLGVFVCFCFQLSLITNSSFGEVIRGYLPSSAVVQSQG